MHLSQESFAHCLLVEDPQPLINFPPEISLLLCVGDIGNLLAHLVLVGHLGDVVPPSAVFFVHKLRMVVVDLVLDGQQNLPDLVEVGGGPGEPGDLDRLLQIAGHANVGELLFQLCNFLLRLPLDGDVKAVLLVLCPGIRKVRFDKGHVDPIMCENIENMVEILEFDGRIKS